MKFFAVFSALVAVACASQSWTLEQLDQAIQNPSTDPAILPYLEQALNTMMQELFAGNQVEAVSVTIPAVDLSAWTLVQLSDAIQNPNTDPALIPHLEVALNQMMEAIVSGHPVSAVAVVVPAMDVSSWTLQEIDAALSNPATNPDLIPYLEHALEEIMTALVSGQQQESVVIATPAGLLPVVPVLPAPVETPVVPAPVETPVTPVLPTPAQTPEAASSPLVQIIVNIQQQQATPVFPEAVAVTPVAVPEVPAPEPVSVVEQSPAFNPIDVLPLPGIVTGPVVVAQPAVVGPMM